MRGAGQSRYPGPARDEASAQTPGCAGIALRPPYRFGAPLFNVEEDDHTLTLTCRACGHIFWYFAHADPIEIQADADDHLLEAHPELWEVHRGIAEAPTTSG